MTKAEMIEKMEALENRINELEEEVMNLEAEKQEIHNHYHSHYHYPKVQQPYIPYVPITPYPTYPSPWWYSTTTGVGMGINTSDTVTWNATDAEPTTHYYTLTA